jgi:type IV pilus assembly protein PilC
MLTAGIPLVQAFEIVGVGHEKPSMQKLILTSSTSRPVTH